MNPGPFFLRNKNRPYGVKIVVISSLLESLNRPWAQGNLPFGVQGQFYAHPPRQVDNYCLRRGLRGHFDFRGARANIWGRDNLIFMKAGARSYNDVCSICYFFSHEIHCDLTSFNIIKLMYFECTFVLFLAVHMALRRRQGFMSEYERFFVMFVRLLEDE
jgi:hypothetical protein